MASLLATFLVLAFALQANAALYSVKYANRTCIMSEMEIALEFRYRDRYNETRMIEIAVPSEPTSMAGKCGAFNDTSTPQSMAVRFFEDRWSMEMGFHYHNASGYYYMNTIDMEFIGGIENFPGSINKPIPCTARGRGLRLFGTWPGAAYSCAGPVRVSLPVTCAARAGLEEGFHVERLEVRMSVTQLEAFRNTERPIFGDVVLKCHLPWWLRPEFLAGVSVAGILTIIGVAAISRPIYKEYKFRRFLKHLMKEGYEQM